MALELAEYLPPLYELSWVEAMNTIASKPPPTLREPQKWSVDFADFLRLCLVKEPTRRASADELLEHGFINREYPPELLKHFVLGDISPRGGMRTSL